MKDIMVELKRTNQIWKYVTDNNSHLEYQLLNGGDTCRLASAFIKQVLVHCLIYTILGWIVIGTLFDVVSLIQFHTIVDPDQPNVVGVIFAFAGFIPLAFLIMFVAMLFATLFTRISNAIRKRKKMQPAAAPRSIVWTMVRAKLDKVCVPLKIVD